jgi:hypothetical protein
MAHSPVRAETTEQPKVRPDRGIGAWRPLCSATAAARCPRVQNWRVERGSGVRTGRYVPSEPGGQRQRRGAQVPQHGQTMAPRPGAAKRVRCGGAAEKPLETSDVRERPAADPAAHPVRERASGEKRHFLAPLESGRCRKWRARPEKKRGSQTLPSSKFFPRDFTKAYM